MASINELTIRKMILGDLNAFTEIYNYYRLPALKFCYSLVKDEEEAENLMQDVLIKIWAKRDQINPELNFHSFLFTCLRNMAFDYLKKMEKNQVLRKQYLQRLEALNEEDAEQKEIQLVMLQTAVDGLSKKRKEILELNIREGKSYQEIADMLRISKNTVKNQLVKAKQYIRERMDTAVFA